MHHIYIKRFSSYREVNKPRLNLKTMPLKLSTEIITVCCENHIEHNGDGKCGNFIATARGIIQKPLSYKELNVMNRPITVLYIHSLYHTATYNYVQLQTTEHLRNKRKYIRFSLQWLGIQLVPGMWRREVSYRPICADVSEYTDICISRVEKYSEGRWTV
jgi:hypothetical protein